jgi:hypothetical protein
MTDFCGNSDITKIFIVEPSGAQQILSAATLTVYGNLTVDGNIINCGSGSTIYTEFILPCESGVTINNAVTIYSTEVLPTSDNLINFGSPTRRYRNVNTVSGTSTVWTSTGVIYTPVLDLGLDSSGNTRIITADSSIIQNDLLDGGIY